MKNSLLFTVTFFLLTGCIESIVPVTGTISGVIKDAKTNQPLSGCAIAIVPGGATTVTGEDGIFHFKDIAADTYSVEASRDGYYGDKKSVIVDAGYSHAVDFLLTPISSTKGSVSGTVKDAKTAQALAGSSVVLMPVGVTIVTGDDGIYRFDDIAAGTYSVEARHTGYYESKKNIIVTSGNIQSVDILLTQYDANDRLPILATVKVTEIRSNSARAEGEVVDGGSSSVSERGFMYSETPNPSITTATRKIVAGGTGVFSDVITDLKERTTYYIVAYAINNRGTAYSEQTLFMTGGAAQDVTPTNVICVSPSGNDAYDGSSWGKAKKTIAAAVSSATPGKQVWVMAGEFRETIQPKDGVDIYGGFNGNEALIDGRTQKTMVTGLSCAEFETPTTVNGFTISNSKIELKGNTVLENSVVTGKYITGTSKVGIIYTSGDVCTIKNCIVEDYMSMQIYGKKLIMINCHYRGEKEHTSYGDPTGIYVEGTTSSELEMYNCLITNNYTGINVQFGKAVKLYNCTIANNIYGLYSRQSYYIELYNCLFWNNENDNGSGYNSCININSSDNDGVKFKKPSSEQGPDASDWQTADWSITAGSIAIDAGVNIYYPLDNYPTDIVGNPRIKGSLIDVGAYEYE